MKMKVIIESVVLLEINYNYELELVKLQKLKANKNINRNDNNNVKYLNNVNNCSQYHILMGSMEDDQIHIIKSVYISNYLTDTVALSNSIRQKVELLQVLKRQEEEVKPLALLIVNSNVNYNSELVNIILDTFQIKYKFEYEPSIRGAIDMAQKYADNELHLKCYYWDYRWYLTEFEINDRNIDLIPASLDMDKHRNSNPRVNYQYTRSDRDINLTDYEVFNKETKEQTEFIKRLINRIDQMIDYLEESPSPSEDILIRINLLIQRLQNVNTENIDIELTLIENEIDIFQTICNQWEIIN